MPPHSQILNHDHCFCIKQVIITPIQFPPSLVEIYLKLYHIETSLERKERIHYIFHNKSNNKVSASFPYRFSDAFMAWVGVIIFFYFALLKGVTFLSITCFPGPPACAILGLPIEEKDLLQIRRHSEPWIKCFTYRGCLASVRNWEDIGAI